MSDLVSPHVLAKASQEIDAMVTGMVPEGKRGALVAVFDQEGAKVGGAWKVLGDDIEVSGELLQRWARVKPTARVVVRFTF